MNFQDLTEEELEELKELGFHFHTLTKEDRAKSIERNNRKSVKYKDEKNDN
jgi:hypothetical protein